MSKIINVSKWLLLISGCIFLILVLWLPYHLDQMREHGAGGLSVVFTPGPESLQTALISFMAIFSILATVISVFVVLPFTTENRTKNPISLFWGILTLFAFFGGILWSLFLILERPLTGTSPTNLDIYWDLRILLVGLSLTMFTITAIIHGDTTKVKPR